MHSETVSWLQDHFKMKKAPSWVVVLGSGLGGFVEILEEPKKALYKDIPHFPSTSVEGHKGELVLGEFDGKAFMVLQGRIHMYEGFSAEQSVYPLRTLHLWGAQNVLLTNAAGSLDPSIPPGHFVILSDHINLTGRNPLIGKEALNWGVRFPDVTDLYSLKLQESLEVSFKFHKVPCSRGVYCGVLGPNYETAAEVRFLGKIGGSVVGMSTVVEALAAHQCGMSVAAVSCVSNYATGLSPTSLTHEEVFRVMESSQEKFSKVIQHFLTSA